MSAPTSAIVAPTKGGAPDMAAAAGVQKMAGGMMLSPLPLGGGGKRSRTRKISKKVKAMIRRMTPKELKKMMKGGEAVEEATAAPDAEQEGARRRRRSRRSSRKSRARKYF